MKTLVIYPGLSPQVQHTKILGFSFLERFILSAKRSGFRNVIFMGESTQLPLEFVLVYPDFLCSDSVWKQIQDRGQSPAGTVPYSPISSKNLPPSKKDWVSFRSSEDLKSAEKWLLNSLIKDEEGFMSKHLERKISLSITKLLINIKITPNQMSLISIGIGIVGAVFFIFAQKWYDIAGALLFWLHSVLDGCDGEIARLKFLESKWGGILDFWGDNVVHSAVFLTIACGLSKNVDSMLPTILASFAIGGTLITATFVYIKTMMNKKSTGPLFTSVTGDSSKNSLNKVINFLARRDFIYLVIALAIFGHIDLFLWMGAIGAPIYFLVILLAEKCHE